MSWTKRVQHPSEIVKKGDTVEVSILNIDPENKRISLGLKQLQEDPWLKIAETHPVEMEVEGKIVRYQDGGIVVDLGGDLEGFVPQAQLPLADGQTAEQETKPGQGVALKVVEVDPIHHRIILAATEFLEMPAEDLVMLSEPEVELAAEAETETPAAEPAEPVEAEAEAETEAPTEVPQPEASAEEATEEAEAKSDPASE
jgi:small subunit ribosomal protein S1